jgi:hypothetical protein
MRSLNFMDSFIVNRKYNLDQGFSNFSAGVPLFVPYHIHCTTNNYVTYGHTVLPVLGTAAIRKIIVTLFVKQADILTAFNRLCVCMGGGGSIFMFLSFDFFFLLSPCTIEPWLTCQWWYA